MGVITDLLAANDSKKREDTRMQLTSAATMANLPGISDEDREYYQKAFHAAAGRALGIPEKHHGTLGSILSSLGNLNPYPKKQPLAGVGPEPEDPILSPEALDAQTAMKEGIARKSRMADTYAQQGTLNDIAEDKVAKERTTKVAALDKMLANREISPAAYATAKQQAYGFHPSTAAPAGTWSQRKLKDKNTGEPLGVVNWNNKTGMFADMNMDPYELPDNAVIDDAKPPLTRQLDEVTAEYEALKYPHVAAREMAGRTLLQRGWTTQMLHDAGYQNMTQKTDINAELSGGVTGSKTPAMRVPAVTPTAPPVPATGAPGGQGATIPPPIGSRVATARAATQGAQAASAGVDQMSPTPVSARVRAARGATGTPAGVTPAGVTPVVQPVAGQGAAPTAPGVLTPAQFERMKATDPTVQQAYQYLTGLTAVRASSGAAGLGLKKGIQKIVQATGLNETQLKSELVARKGAAEALDTAQKRLGAYGSVEKTIQGMGEVLQEAYRRHPQSDWKFWNAVKIAQSDKISGDPEIDAVRTAIEGYKTAYGKFMTGGAMSNAQIPVASQSRTHEVINNTMSGKEITAILKQVRDEADNEHKKLVENAAELSQQIAAPIGQWNTDPSASAGDVAVKALPANATPLQKFLAKHGGQ